MWVPRTVCTHNILDHDGVGVEEHHTVELRQLRRHMNACAGVTARVGVATHRARGGACALTSGGSITVQS